MAVFVELKMNRGPEAFNVEGIMHVAPQGDDARIYLFGIPHPSEVRESYDSVMKKIAEAK